MSEHIVAARDLTRQYTVGESVLEVLNGVDMTIGRGEIIAIIGESGAGKSTLLHILGLLDRPTSGELHLNGKDVTGLTDEQLAEYRNGTIGFVFQFHHLLPEFTALENVLMPAIIGRSNGPAAKERAQYLLSKVGLEGRLNHHPNELSGGELQRVAVARALMNEPALVLADEPSGNLDHRNSLMLHDLLWDMAKEHAYTFVIVTHDMALAGQADRVLHLSEGLLHEVAGETLRELTRTLGV